MDLRKITAGAAAAALTLSLAAVSVSAETKAIDTEYPGDWSSSGVGITKEELTAVGGDIKIVLDVEIYDKFGLADQYLVNVIDYDNGWVSQSSMENGFVTSDTLTVKADGWICVNKADTQLEFVLDAACIDALGDDGVTFSCKNVLVKNCTWEKGDKQKALDFVSDADGKAYCFADLDGAAPAAEEEAPAETEEAPAAEEEAAPAEEEAAPAEAEEAPAAVEEAPAPAPADDTTTTPAATGNTAASAMVITMALAAAAAVAAKRK